MSATDWIRESVRVARTGDAVEHTAVLVRTDAAEALCDLADDVRAAIDHDEHCVACGDHTDNCRCDMADVRSTLARLDGEGA